MNNQLYELELVNPGIEQKTNLCHIVLSAIGKIENAKTLSQFFDKF